MWGITVAFFFRTYRLGSEEAIVVDEFDLGDVIIE